MFEKLSKICVDFMQSIVEEGARESNYSTSSF